MKICAICRRTYAEATQFCLDDGAPLQVVTSAMSEQQTVVQPVPTAPTAAPALTGIDGPSKPPPLPGRPPSGLNAVSPASRPPASRTPAPHGQGPASTAPRPAAAHQRNHTILHPNPPANLAEAETFVSSLSSENVVPDEEQSAYIGKIIDERYLVLSLIGRGGMGAVYRAEQIHLRKTMAIKLLHENLGSRKQLISRFTREARAISRLSSPHTVMVFDFGRWNELFYLVMELLEGEALDALLEREGPLPADRTARIVLQMCDSLTEAHKHGIVHRDLKPENVMLLRQGPHPDFVKILDFGLAKVQGVDDPYTIHSQRDIFGTPFYMSPEQIRAGDVDGRADVYAVGALLFKMLTGKHVFGSERNTFDILRAHLMEPSPRMAAVAPEAKVPEAFEQIVARALAKEPAHRFQSMEELSQALQAAQTTGFADAGLPSPAPVAVPVAAAPAGPTAATDQPTSRPTVQRPADAILAAAAAAARQPALDAENVLADEALEQNARRSRRLRVAGFFAAVVGGLGVLALLVTLGAGSEAGYENEPNDSPGQANALGADGKGRGVIGKRRSKTASDQDCFRLPALRDTDELTVRVQGVPNMDLQVALFGPQGEPRASQSHRGRGQGEVLRYLDTRRPLAAVCVTEFIGQNAHAGESLSDEYVLEVQVGPRPQLAEREPNDETGNELVTGRPLLGSLDGPGDRDVFALQGTFEDRIVRITLDLHSGQAQAGARLALVDGAGRTLASETLRQGELRGVLAFVANGRQMPDRLVLQRVSPKGAPVAADEVAYTVRYEHHDLADQTEVEPNNTEDSATSMVLGAWHVGHADDAAGVDWLRIDGGDPSMRRIRVEAIAPPGSAWWLVVRDLGEQVDLRKVQVTPGNDQDLLISGSGAGFLVRIQQAAAPGARRGVKGAESRYQIRARYLSGEDAVVQPLTP